MSHHREAPVKRQGKRGVRWIARYTNIDGKRVSAGTFERKGPCRERSQHSDCCAQHAIDAAYDRPVNTGTVGDMKLNRLTAPIDGRSSET